MRKFIDLIAHELGFRNLTDLAYSSLGWKTGLFAFVQMCGACISVAIGFTKEWIWDPPSAAIIFGLLVLTESLSGTWVAVRIKRERFNFRKFYNIGPKLVAHIFFLSISYNLGKYSPILFWLPNATFGWFATRNFLSTLLNAVEMKLVKGEFANYIKNKLSIDDKELIESIDRDLKK